MQLRADFVAFVTIPVLTAQVSQGAHKTLQRFLSLSDSELSRLQMEKNRSSVTRTDFQQRQLDEAAGVLRHAWVYQAVSLGLISARQSPGTALSYDEISSLSLQLSRDQLEALRKLPSEPIEQRLKVLTDAQRQRLATYEAKLELATDAIALGLIPRPARGEPLCT